MNNLKVQQFWQKIKNWELKKFKHIFCSLENGNKYEMKNRTEQNHIDHINKMIRLIKKGNYQILNGQIIHRLSYR